MSDRPLEIEDVTAEGRWSRRAVVMRGTLVVEPRGVLLQSADRRLLTSYERITGAGWTGEVLTLHRGGDALALSGSGRLAQAWSCVVERACALPEVTRGLRSLGTRHGGDPALQQRFFGPLLAGRRRLEDPEPPELRLAGFDGNRLASRILEVLAGMARELHPASEPHRRATEAALHEVADQLVVELGRLGELGAGVLAAPERDRFTAWRAWTSQLRPVFAEADRAWVQALGLLREVPA